MFSLNF